MEETTDNIDKKPEEELWVDLRPAAAIAQIFTFIALVIYIYNILSQCMCLTFTQQFFRQLAYIFQTIRMFLLMAALLPCLLHGQVRSVDPKLTGLHFAGSVLLVLLGNILVAIGIRKFIECNRDSLLCLWSLAPCSRRSCCTSPNYCRLCCGSDPNLCCTRTTCNLSCSGSRSCCEPSPVCCPKARPSRPRKNRKNREKSCPDFSNSEQSKPRCKKSGCSCWSLCR
ncbi:hypothetical protein EGW08_010924 [Elysia chlorotica]|uniref:Uncharacterized protein n=1 Tax=Elysia chlorotica TaxID=188477 RepID=A0A3S1HKF1_ELYCH|nr:hypothetical protein EGW08_010924 [Elysia chlorotica]